LERYHGGKIPNSTEVTDRVRLQSAPRTDEPLYHTAFGYPMYGYKEAEVPEEVEEYRRAFGNVREAERTTRYGSRMAHDGLHSFQRYLETYEYWRKRAERLEHTLDRRQARLEKREAGHARERQARLDELEARTEALGGSGV
jgi:hypothetical protein